MSSGSNNPGSNSGNPFQDVFPQSPQPRQAVPVTQFSPMPPDQHIIEAITDEINDIDLSIHHPIYLNDSDPPEDSILVPRPETPHGSLFYSTARNLGVVNTITNNVPIRSFVKRVFKLFELFQINGGPVITNVNPSFLTSPLPAEYTTFHGAVSTSNTSGNGNQAGAGGGDDDDPDDGNGDFDDADDDEDEEDEADDNENMQIVATNYLKSLRKTFKQNAHLGNVTIKNLKAVKTFHKFLLLTQESLLVALRMSQVDVRTVGQAAQRSPYQVSFPHHYTYSPLCRLYYYFTLFHLVTI